MFLGQNRAAGSDSADERQPELFPQDILELNTARSAGNQIDDALALQGAQMFLSRVGGFETERARDFRTSRRHTVFGNSVLNEPEYLRLTGREIGHVGTCICSQLLSLYTVSRHWQVGRCQGNLR